MSLSQGQLKKLGKRLSARHHESFPEAVETYVEYSLSHLPILKAVTDSLWERIAADPEVATRDIRIGARLKQVRSVSAKLRRLSSGLSGMHDLAGCRVVVPDLWDQAVVTRIANSVFLVKAEYDYRKDDNRGYRGYHLVLQGFANGCEPGIDWPSRGLVELQVRTELQDLWANVSEIHGKYSASERHKDQLNELSETLWRLDQVRLALRIASEEQQLLRRIVRQGSPVQAVVDAWRRGDAELYYVPKSQEAMRRDRITNALDLIPVESPLRLHKEGNNEEQTDGVVEILYGLFGHARLMLGVLDKHTLQPLHHVLSRGLEPRKRLRKNVRFVGNKASLILETSKIVRESFAMDPLWIDQLPHVKEAATGVLTVDEAGKRVPIVPAVVQDIALSWFGLCRTFALVTAISSPLVNGAHHLERLADKRVREWSEEQVREWSKDHWRENSWELSDWDGTALELRSVLAPYVKLEGEDQRLEPGNNLVSRLNGVMGHLVGLRDLRDAFGRGSEEAEYVEVRNWIEHRDQVGGDAGLGPHDLLNEIVNQVTVDEQLLRRTLRVELGDDKLRVWDLNPQTMNFRRFLKLGGVIGKGEDAGPRDREFCVVVRGEADLTGDVVATSHNHEVVGDELRRRTAQLMRTGSDGEVVVVGEAVVMYTELKRDHIETHLRYFMDARGMVERIMEDVEDASVDVDNDERWG